jgi:aminoglycoside phosphotransferase (APT) family kinase protein
MGTPAGVDAAFVTDWLATTAGAVEPPLSFEVIQGGRSNLTYTVTDMAGRRWVLRRPPLSGVLPSAHDMSREHRILAALQSSPVPVPHVVGYEPAGDRLSEFYVMDFVDGHVLRTAQAAQSALTPAARHAAAESLIDVLVALHEIDPDAVGLGSLARREGYIERQLRRWHGQLVRTQEAGAREVPVLHEVHRRLSDGVPVQHSVAIVHGDYRLDNVIVGDDGRIRAVLDWELCTLGDPLADVGLLAVYWADPGDEDLALEFPPTLAEGFPRRADIIARYGQRSGRDLSQIDYYVAFALWKLAVILEGVFTRFAAGAYGGGDDTWKPLGDKVEALGDAALRAVAGQSPWRVDR